MALAVTWILSFAAGFTALLAAGFAAAAAVERHPDLLEEFREGRGSSPWPARSFRFLLAVSARDLSGTRFERLRRRISVDLVRAASKRHPTAELFLGRALLEGVAVAASSLGVTFAVFGEPFVVLSFAAGAGHAFLLRPQLLHSEAEARVSRISRQLPYSLDLAILVLRAGGTLWEGLKEVSRDAEHDPLAQEVALALAQIEAGTPRDKALSEMAGRVRLEELTTLVTALVRGEATGAPMVKTLESQAEVFRFRRLQKIERLAVEAPVKMMFPNMIIMLAVLLVVLGPVMIDLVLGGFF